MRDEANQTNLCREGDVFELAVPVVLALDHGAAVDLAGLELDRDDVARRLVQQLHRDPEAAAHPLTGWSGSHAAGGSPYPVVGGWEQQRAGVGIVEAVDEGKGGGAARVCFG